MNRLQLSETFLEKMKRLLGESYPDYLACYEEEPYYGLRINTRKLTPEQFAEKAAGEGWELTPIPWIWNGFYYPSALRPARHPWYYAGLYYLQEPSAMTPASLLPVSKGDRVLDLCAAPGGKSTELAARLCGSGLLCSNDISHSRAKALVKNLELSGAENICVFSETPQKLAEKFPDFFDKILVDAPCSGEGMFRRDPDMIKSYEEKGPDYYAPIQREIVSAAVRMLAPDGMLLYSTCTFDETEDEGTIRWLLEQNPDLSLVPLAKKEGFEAGIRMPECVRLFPHKLKGEGHFIALLTKKAAASGGAAGNGTGKNPRTERTGTGTKKGKQELEPVFAFLKQISGEWMEERFHLVNEQVYYLPEAFSGTERLRLQGIRCLRTGLFLGDLKKGRFEPSQALAMTLRETDYPCTLKLSAQDDRCIRYLKGETLSLTEEEAAGRNGSWCLVCADGFPLGWGKLQNQTLKNKYYSGWRWQ